MNRDAAVELCREEALKETTVRHVVSVEGASMRGPFGPSSETRRPPPELILTEPSIGYRWIAERSD